MSVDISNRGYMTYYISYFEATMYTLWQPIDHHSYTMRPFEQEKAY